MKSMRSRLWVGMLGMLVITFALAEPITIKQVITLKRIGYTDEQVAQEAAKSLSDTKAAPGASKRDATIDLNADAIRQLRAAGAGEPLIQYLCTIAKITTTQEVIGMAKAQQSLEQIVEHILAPCPNPCPRPGITADEARLLVTRQLPAAVIVALAGRPLGPQQLIMLGEAGTPLDIFEKLADALGFDRVKEAPEPTTAMTEAGAPATITDEPSDARGFGRTKDAPESTTAMTEAGVAATITDEPVDARSFDRVKEAPESTKAMTEVSEPATITDEPLDARHFGRVKEAPESTTAMPEAGVPATIADEPLNARRFDRVEMTTESTKAMAEAGVPVSIIVAFTGLPLGPQQLIMLAEAKTPIQTFNKLGDTLGFEPIQTTVDSIAAMTRAGVPGDIIARLEKATVDKTWAKKVAPYRKIYNRLLRIPKVNDQFSFSLPDSRDLTATYSDMPQTYYIGGGKEEDAESFVGPLWRLEISKSGFHFFSGSDIDVSLAIRRDDTGKITLYRVEGPHHVADVPLDGDIRSFAAILGIDLNIDAVPPGA